MPKENLYKKNPRNDTTTTPTKNKKTPDMQNMQMRGTPDENMQRCNDTISTKTCLRTNREPRTGGNDSRIRPPAGIRTHENNQLQNPERKDVERIPAVSRRTNLLHKSGTIHPNRIRKTNEPTRVTNPAKNLLRKKTAATKHRRNLQSVCPVLNRIL